MCYAMGPIAVAVSWIKKHTVHHNNYLNESYIQIFAS